MAVIDVAGFVADLKSHAIDHGFHVHDERHFVETYSLRQLWEVDLHPEEACNGPIDLHLSLEVDPRALLDRQRIIGHVAVDPRGERATGQRQQRQPHTQGVRCDRASVVGCRV